MDRFSDDRDNFEASNSGVDPDEGRHLGHMARRKPSGAQAEEGSDAELDPQDEGEERSKIEKPPEHRSHQALHPYFPTHRPTFGRKGL